MLSVQNNMLAKNANRQLDVNIKKNVKISEKLSSGYRINRAADDAAGLAISEKMRRQIRGLNQAGENIKDGIGYVQTAEGALNEVHEMLQRINELAVKAANGTNNVEDRAYINEEIQALKSEVARIFSTTTFNEQRIWEPEEYTPIVDYTPKQAVTFNRTGYNQRIDVTNANCGVVALGGYNIDADQDGVRVSWTGYDGNSYETERFSWDTLKEKNYQFDIEPTDADGNVLFTYNVSMSVQENATVDDIIACINDTWLSSDPSVSVLARFEDQDRQDEDGINYPGISIWASMPYAAAYVSKDKSENGYDFDDENNIFFEPKLNANNSNLTKFPSATLADDARNSDETWEFSFYMEGIGTVTAKPSSFSYRSNDLTADDEGLWWHWAYYSDGTRYQSYNWRYLDNTDLTLAGVMSTLTGERTDETPGLLNRDNKGVGDTGGLIDLDFVLRSDNPYTYGVDSSSDYVGYITIRIYVDAEDDEQKVLDKITTALNADTIVDLYNKSANYDRSYAEQKPANDHTIQLPVYGDVALGGRQYFWVQAGAEAGQHIDITYDALSLYALGMQDTNTLTVESASSAIDEVKGAIQIVSEQRSLFGAYQNRLEHAYNINKNVEENTQSAESLIRDTDIADMMMEYSINNILLQAGTSMLAQANQSSQGILELLS